MPPAIELKNITKSFKQLIAVNDITLSIQKGEYIALLGPNGAGKTTLIEMIEGIQTPDKGEINIAGKNWHHHENELHHLIGLSLQETKFIDKLSVEETLDLFGSFYHLSSGRTKEILKLVNLEEKRKSYTATLSGGQKQRLALGIALLNEPEILLLDEPTTGLDPTARREIWQILENLKQHNHTTMILTTHYMEEAEYLCDRILIMDHGKFLAEGTLTELTTTYGEGDIIDFTLSGNSKTVAENAGKGVKKVIWQQPNFKGRLVVDNIANSLPVFLDEVEKEGLKVLELECRKMTLDDLFISMTGRHLHE